MGSPVPSFDSQWDPFEDPSQEHTQADNCWDLQYSPEWKVTMNNRAIMPKVTEPEQDVPPADFWEHSLEPKLERFLCKKNRSLRAESTTVVVSVTARSTPAVTKLFDDTTIDWSVIERQLIEWGELFHRGKKLKLSISFNYVDAPQSTTTSLRRTEKRGRLSRTHRMLAERDEQVGAEEAASGEPSIWADMYRLFRCPGHPCELGPYCWIDPVDRKHCKLLGSHIESLVEYKQQGHTLQTHEDVPEDIRQKLYDEEKKSLERHKKPTTSVASLPIPITITVLPGPAATPAADMPSKCTLIDRLNIPGLLEKHVEEYCAWHESRVKTLAWKEDCKKACDVMIKHGVDLDQIRWDPDPKFLTDEGVSKGTAKRVVSDIDYWFDTVKRRRIEEELY
jgi:hypothetical protein